MEVPPSCIAAKLHKKTLPRVIAEESPSLGLLQKMALPYMGHAFYNNPPKLDQPGLTTWFVEVGLEVPSSCVREPFLGLLLNKALF